jgi:glycosyltransferase involved in cell wall biosynthesis
VQIEGPEVAVLGNPSAPVVAVLTPVYNGEAYLAECIESVLAQTLQDWQYVIVDNQSTDRSAAIAQRFAAADARIRLVRADSHVDVHGNYNRAAGLMPPGTRYCKFLGADDRLMPTALERMVAVAERHPSVGVVSSLALWGDRVEHRGLVPEGEETFPGRTVVERGLGSGPWVTGSPTSLLFRADLVRAAGTFLDSSVWHSDTDAAYRTLLDTDLGFVHEALTFTRLHPAALTSFSERVNSYASHAVRMLVRYGPKVLGAGFRTAMRTAVRQYGWYLVKQRLKPSRWSNREFTGFHRQEIGKILAELGGESEYSAEIRFCEAFLGTADVEVPNPGLGREHATAGGVAAAVVGLGRK